MVDTGKPLVTAIERVAADDSNIDTDGVTSTTPVTFKVSFSEAIDASTVTAGDFVASNGTVGTVVEDSSTLVTDAVAGSGYTSTLVEVTPAQDGEALSVLLGTSFTDIAGNTLVPDLAECPVDRSKPLMDLIIALTITAHVAPARTW